MKNKNAGFTLVEMIVSVALFAVVMLMVSSAYLVIIAGNRAAQAVGSASNDLAFALDTMARTIRTGTNYACGGGADCFPSPGSTFAFTNNLGQSVTYALSGTSIIETVNGTTYPLTDSSVSISTLNFYAQGDASAGSGDYRQPQVLITISGSVSAGPGKTLPFTIETGATMRLLDL